jgi:Tfp pilus assembly protein PilZ
MAFMDSNTLLSSMFIGAAIFVGFVLVWFLRIFYKKRMTSNHSGQILVSSQSTSWEEKRKHPRVSVSWSAVIETSGGSEQAQLKDISLGGAFVVCQKPLSLSEKFCMTISTEAPQAIRLNAEVVWSNVNVPADRIINRGMGVRFIDNSNEDRNRLNAAIKSHLDKALR